MAEEKKNGVVVKDDHNEFELMLRFFGNEILAIKEQRDFVWGGLGER